MTQPISQVPVSLICGHLGVGKTTAIRSLMAGVPEGERWAVLVNEFGEIGLDGAILEEGDFAVREIPGGCVCCARGPQLQIHLVRLLREVRPDRVLVEPTGLALPGAILDLLRRPGMKEAVARRAVITLVDPRRLGDPRLDASEAFHAQVQAADVLVASHADEATPEQLTRFHAWAGALWPPKAVVAEASHGALDPAWLDLDPTPSRVVQTHEHHHEAHTVTSMGWIWPPDVAFDRPRLVTALQALMHDHPALPGSVLRLKGVLRTPGAWLHVEGTPDELRFEPWQHRRDSRVELLVPTAPAASPEAVLAHIEAARLV